MKKTQIKVLNHDERKAADFWESQLSPEDAQPTSTMTTARRKQFLQQPDLGDPASQQILGGGDFQDGFSQIDFSPIDENETSREQ